MKETNLVEITRSVGKLIRQRRNQLGYTMQQVADRLGISVQQIAKYEQGTSRITCPRLYFISKALDCMPNDFFRGLNIELSVLHTAKLN